MEEVGAAWLLLTLRPSEADEDDAWLRLGFWGVYCDADWEPDATEEVELDEKGLSTEPVGTGNWGETGDCGW